jgi:hypothetical protein
MCLRTGDIVDPTSMFDHYTGEVGDVASVSAAGTDAIGIGTGEIRRLTGYIPDCTCAPSECTDPSDNELDGA